MAKIKWGIISTARIARIHVIPGMQAGEYCEIAAIASRKLESARAMADDFSIPKAYGSYEELLADPEIQAVYNPLPNHLHVPWSIKAAEAGKHVLCEKPLALNAEDAETLVKACKANGVLLMEAFMYRMHTQWQTAKRMVQEGKIGEVRTIQTFFSYTNLNPDDIRNNPDIGGGGLMDIGCYPISASRFIFDAEPIRVVSLIKRHAEWQTDILTSAMLEFPAERQATFTCSTQLTPYQRVNIFGDQGRIEIEIPFNAPEYEPTRIYHETDAGIETITLDTCHQYQVQGDLMSRAILEGTAVPTPPEDAVANMKVIDALFRSERSGDWEQV